MDKCFQYSFSFLPRVANLDFSSLSVYVTVGCSHSPPYYLKQQIAVIYSSIPFRICPRHPRKPKTQFSCGKSFSRPAAYRIHRVLTELPEGRSIIILWWLLAMEKLSSIYRQPTAHSLSGRSSHLLRTWLIITGTWLKNACSIFKGRDSLRAALNAFRSYGCIVTDAERNEQELRVHNFWGK